MPPLRHRVGLANRGGRPTGATVQYDPAAAEDSVVRVREFLANHLGG